MKVATLEEVATIERQSVAPGDIDGDEAYVGLENITSGGEFIEVGCAGEAGLRSNKFRFGPEHILYGKLRPYLSKIAQPTFPGVCSTDILPVRAGPLVDQRFLLHYLRLPHMVGQADKNSSGANLPRLSPKVLALFEIPLPPIEEQRRIAAVLDAADALRAKRRQAIAKLDTLTQAIFIDVMGQGGSGQWPVQSIESVAKAEKGSIRTGPFGSQLLHEEFTDEGIAVLGIDNAVGNEFRWGERRYISPEKYEQLKRFTVHPGDVLVTIMGTCGRAAIVPDDIPAAINTKHLCCVTLDAATCQAEWLWACLRFHPDVLHQLGATHGAVMPGLNTGRIKQARIPVPPREVQEHFATLKRAVDDEMLRAKSVAGHLDTLFASLQQRAFRGEL